MILILLTSLAHVLLFLEHLKAQELLVLQTVLFHDFATMNFSCVA